MTIKITLRDEDYIKLWDENNNKPDQYVKTKRGSELFFHTACLESLKRMNDAYKN